MKVQNNDIFLKKFFVDLILQKKMKSHCDFNFINFKLL